MSPIQSPHDSSSSVARPRFALPPLVAFAGSVIAFMTLYLAAGAPTPLLPLYREQWNFPASLLTVAFAAYASGFLAATLTVGSLSDHVGRRPVLIGSLLVQLLATGMFVLAPDAGWVIAARVVQGVATGAATSAFSASITELAPSNRKKLGTFLGSIGVNGALILGALGALLAGVVIEFSSQPGTIIFTVLAVITSLGILVVTFTPESADRRPGAWRSLPPRVDVAAAARKEFAAAVPVLAAVWMLAGLAVGVAPSLVRTLFEVDTALLNGLIGLLTSGTSAIAGLLSSRLDPRVGMQLGIYTATAGTIGIVTGAITETLSLMIIGLVISGVGFGSAFSATLRLIMPMVGPEHKAGTTSSIFVLANIAFGLPIVLVGLLAEPFGLLSAVAGSGAAITLLGLSGLIAQCRVTHSV